MKPIDRILNKAQSGGRIDVEECITLFESDQIEKIGDTANQIMKKWHPDPITTFVIGRNINYTNICDVYCRFCAFYRAPGSAEGYVLPDETIFQKIQETLGCRWYGNSDARRYESGSAVQLLYEYFARN